MIDVTVVHNQIGDTAYVSNNMGTKMRFLRYGMIGAAFLGLAGCGTIANQFGGKPLANNIDEDAIRLNNSHARAINGVITVNALRARDRWPTGYTTLSGVRFMPTRSLNGTLNLGPLGFGSGDPRLSTSVPRPLASSSLSGGGTLASGAQYDVQPFAGQDNSQGLYSTARSEGLLRRYADSNWPLEVLLPLFVSEVYTDNKTCRIGGSDYLAKFLNGYENAEEDFTNKYGEEDKELHPCWTVYRILSGAIKLEYISKVDLKDTKSVYTKKTLKDRADAREELRKECKQIALPMNTSLLTSSGDLAARISAIANTADRDVIIDPGGVRLCNRANTQCDFYYTIDDKGTKYKKAFDGLSFRTFDDMVYFVGETLRLRYPNSSGQQEYGLSITTGDKDQRLNFFRVSDAGLRSTVGRAQRGYGVEVRHAGRNWRALPEKKGSEFDAGIDLTERTGTVLGILSQIYILNQSPGFLEAPENILLQ